MELERSAEMKDTYNDGYKTEDIKCIIVDFITEDGKGGYPIMRQGTYVLCKDCKYNGRDEDVEWSPEDIACEYWAIDGLEADDFCSRGERR